MGNEQAISLSLSPAQEIALRLEQVPWDAKPRTWAEYNSWLAERGYAPTVENSAAYWQAFRSPCNADGCIYPQVRVYTAAGLSYTLRASYGTFGNLDENNEFTVGSHQRIEGERREESVEFGNAATVGLEFIDSLDSWEWEGDVYLADGSVLSPPPQVVLLAGKLALTDAAGSALLAADGTRQRVDGTLRVGYTVSYDLHTLEIVPRDVDEAVEHAEGFDVRTLYQSTVRAFYSGRVERVAIEPPDQEALNSCEGRIGTAVVITPAADEVTVLIEPYDYCVGDTITAESCIYVNDLPIGPDRQVTVVRGRENTVRIIAPGYVASDQDRLLDNDTFTVPLEDE